MIFVLKQIFVMFIFRHTEKNYRYLLLYYRVVVSTAAKFEYFNYRKNFILF